MLTLEQIIDLQGKGFTYEQLQFLNGMDVSIPLPNQEPEPKPEPETKSEPKPEPEKKPEDDTISGLKHEIATLTETIKAMQEQNVKNAKSEPETAETVEDIISSFMTAS